MNWKTVKHGDITIAEGLRIAELKNQHWPYGIDSQIHWMKINLQDDDIHLIGEENEECEALKAYITLSQLRVDIDGESYDSIGIGGVCVDINLQHFGLGRQLVEKANAYIKHQDKLGILLCKDGLVDFYKKCGWSLLRYQTSVIAGRNYEHNIMLLDINCSCSEIIINRNF